MNTEKFIVTGMTCSACSASVEKSVSKLNGVEKVNVNLLTNKMTVTFNESALKVEDIISTVKKSGYGAEIEHTSENKKQNHQIQQHEDETKSMRKRLIISFFFLIPLFYISMGHMMGLPMPSFFLGHKNAITFAFTQFLLSLPIVFVNLKYFTVGFKSLFKGKPNMDSLIAIGSSAAMIYGIYAIYKIGYGLGTNDMDMVHNFSMDLYFESAGMILALITLGKFLEARAKGKTSEAITKLVNLAPKTATVLRDDVEIEIDTSDVIVGDIVIVKPGQSIPVDGTIIEGSSSIDESALTGESIPVSKSISDKVIGASINKSGYFKFRAEKVGDNTTLSEIIKLVEEASSSKAPIAKLADKVSNVFVPIVIAIALVSAIVWLFLGSSFEFALSIGIAVLVISCPCALGLATPTAIMVATGKGAENGILIKSAESLETLHSINTVVLDKTGTITEGKPSVTDIIPIGDISTNDLLSLAYSLEKLSEHPLSVAICEYAEKNNLKADAVSDFAAIHGKGIKGTINGELYFAGNLSLMLENNINISNITAQAEALAKTGKTPLFFANTNSVIGVIAVADTIKPTSKAAVLELQKMGIDVIMLTGDNKTTANAIKEEAGIKTVIAEVMPADKEKTVKDIMEQGKRVAMVGDGINDSPALARADVGIAIGAGTDVAIESADIVLMKSDLLDAVSAIQLSRSTIVNIKQNLFWALIYNTLGIPLAAGIFLGILGFKLNPMFAAFAMSFSSVCVVLNALRLKLFKPKLHFTNNLYDEGKELKNENDQGVFTMITKEIMINGMSCGHCSGRVEKALNELEGVTATVNLESKTATVTLSRSIDDEVLAKVITEAGYEVVSIK